MALAFPANPTTGQRYQNWVFDGVKWVVQASTLSEAPNTPIAYSRDGATGVWVPESPNNNKFINPFMEIDQANEGASVVVTNTSRYGVDGFSGTFQSSTGAGSINRAQVAVPSGNTNALRLITTTAAASVAAGDYTQVAQAIEQSDLQDTGFGTPQAQPITLQFWAFCTIAGTYFISILNRPPNVSRSYVTPFTIATANTWQFFTITIPGDATGAWTLSGNSAGMIVVWTVASGTTFQTATLNTWQTGALFAGNTIGNAFMTNANAQFFLGPIKLEVGSKATPMLRTSFQQELARCQRYYEKSYPPGVAPATTGSTTWTWFYFASSGFTPAGPLQLGGSIYFKSTKRAGPTMTFFSPATGAAGMARDGNSNVDVAVTVAASGPQLASAWAPGGSNTSSPNLQLHWAADARL